MKKLAFIGLGVMGSRLANNLILDGHKVFIYDIHNETYKNIPKGKPCKDIKELITKCDNILFLSLPDPAAVEQVMLGEDGVINNQKNNLIIVDTTTSSPSVSKKMAKKAAEKNMIFLDAPLSGGPEGIKDRNLSFFIGGEKLAVEKIKPIIEPSSKRITQFNQSGMGNALKIINNMIAVTNLVTVIEAFVLGTKYGFEPQELYDSISSGSGNSYVLKKMGARILQRDFIPPHFPINLEIKDISLATSLAKSLDVPAFMGNMAEQLFRMSKTKGIGSEDCVALIKLYEELVGIIVKA